MNYGKIKFLVGIALLFQWTFASIARTDENPTNEQLRFFETKVRPLLAEKCWKCHNADEQKGGLRLDSLPAMLQGGDSGAAIVPGKPDESLLVEAIRYQSFEMPPTGRLPESEIAVLTKWVAMGNPWPGSDRHAPKTKPRETFSDEDRNWWAIQPLKPVAVPSISGSTWPKNEIDQFILDRMSTAKLTPANEADRQTLVRRLYFDVWGLPPTPAQVDAFINNPAEDAYEQLVDDLLDSPRYGENAARQWLDLVRYADSDGYRADGFRPEAWRYRDYVIQSFNTDKPYDRFVQEQIAGDELFPNDLAAQVALGYLRHWVYEWNIRDARGQWNTILDDITDTTADVFLGLGLQCAKCHDHKFDPLLRKDYFRLRAFFSPILPNKTIIADEAQRREHASKLAVWHEQTAPLQSEIDAIEAPYREKLKYKAIQRFPDDVQAIAFKSNDERTPAEAQLAHLVFLQVEAEYKELEAAMQAKDKERALELRRKIEKFSDQRPADLPIAMTVTDVGPTPPPTTIPKRTNELIEPGFPTIIESAPAVITALPTVRHTTGRRAALARWLTQPDNPLTTRVIVNRVWQSHFGRGLAANTSDFGRLGEPATHPELLDWLTLKFVRAGWSLKTLHRLILNSATYRQSTNHALAINNQTIDPVNRYYWRSDTRRLSAEKIRDAILSVSGQLTDRSSGPGATPDVPCRTIFTRVMRNSSDELLESFDLPLFFSSNSSRNTTTTPIQSLLLINSDSMLQHARKLAQSIAAESNVLDHQIQAAYRLVYGRLATESELRESMAFIAAQTDLISNLNAERNSSIIETAKLPYRNGQAIRFDIDTPELQLSVPHASSMDVADFTVETFFQLRSVDDGSTVRTLLGKWNGKLQQPGWSLGVTGHGSRRKPQTLVVQLIGERLDGSTGERAIFSDQHIEIAKPYYVAASVRLARDSKPGTVTFYLKDLSNDDEPLLTAVIEHDVVGGFSNDLPLTFGALSSKPTRSFDGLMDDTRWVGRALSVDQLLYSVERTLSNTIGLWQFESDPGVTRNTLTHGPHLKAQGRSVVQLTAPAAAMVDFCHSLLNSNEFLYVH